MVSGECLLRVDCIVSVLDVLIMQIQWEEVLVLVAVVVIFLLGGAEYLTVAL